MKWFYVVSLTTAIPLIFALFGIGARGLRLRRPVLIGGKRAAVVLGVAWLPVVFGSFFKAKDLVAQGETVLGVSAVLVQLLMILFLLSSLWNKLVVAGPKKADLLRSESLGLSEMLTGEEAAHEQRADLIVWSFLGLSILRISACRRTDVSRKLKDLPLKKIQLGAFLMLIALALALGWFMGTGFARSVTLP